MSCAAHSTQIISSQHHRKSGSSRRLLARTRRAALSLLYLCLHTMPRAWGKLNTDFPNYYLSARIAHEGSDTARLYEWVWLQREKDHRALDPGSLD